MIIVGINISGGRGEELGREQAVSLHAYVEPVGFVRIELELEGTTRGESMEIKLWWSDKIYCPEAVKSAKNFFQMMSNRLIQGEVRYGPAKREQKYMTRLTMELKDYKREGNMEQLINIANYALLESMAPENEKFHFNAEVESVTRGKI